MGYLDGVGSVPAALLGKLDECHFKSKRDAGRLLTFELLRVIALVDCKGTGFIVYRVLK